MCGLPSDNLCVAGQAEMGFAALIYQIAIEGCERFRVYFPRGLRFKKNKNKRKT